MSVDKATVLAVLRQARERWESMPAERVSSPWDAIAVVTRQWSEAAQRQLWQADKAVWHRMSMGEGYHTEGLALFDRAIQALEAGE